MSFQSKGNSNRAPINAKVSNEVKDYSNDPTVIQRGAESKAFLEKYGFPQMLLKKRYEHSLISS